MHQVTPDRDSVGRLAVVAHGLRGWPLVTIGVVVGVFLVLFVGLTLLAQHQAKQDARLRITVATQPPDLAIPCYLDAENVIESAVESEKASCPASLAPMPKPRRAPVVRVGQDAAEDANERGFKVSSRGGPTVEEFLKAQEAGDKFAAGYEQALQALTASSKGLLGGLLRPEDRTQDQYRAEVDRYIAAYGDYLLEQVQWNYVHGTLGLLALGVSNPTDRVFEDVRVQIYIPGQVMAMDPACTDRPGWPARPRSYGSAPPLIRAEYPYLTSGSRARLAAALQPPMQRPTIDNSGSARVTFPPVTLRPRDEDVPLDRIVLVIQEAPGTRITGTSKATALNADGVSDGSLCLQVRNTPLPVSELVARDDSDDE